MPYIERAICVSEFMNSIASFNAVKTDTQFDFSQYDAKNSI
jgi:hypothetical protein